MTSEFIKSPQRTEDFISNVRFQLENVEGWQMAFRDGFHKDQGPERIKAECLADAANQLLAHFNAQKEEGR